jgi:hypothetical protein
VIGEVVAARHAMQALNVQLKAAIVTRGVDDAAFQKAQDAHNTTDAAMRGTIGKSVRGRCRCVQEPWAEDV